jgi:type II secretory pathway predicted ATPase ExeA/outer membrane protein OmpA-like peptidoglycan-associated protein
MGDTVYRDRFGLKCKPFGNTPDPLFFYFSADHRQGLVTLSQGIHDRCGLMLLLGEVGTGKTNMCYHLHNHEGYSSAYLNYPFLTESEFLESVNKELGIPVGDGSRRRNRAELQDYLLRQQDKGNPVVIIVDEAHRLGIPILDEILILSNLQVADGHLLQIILAGQPLLLDTLKQSRLQSLNQRIGLRYHLARMDRANTIDYICHRLAKAGCTNQSLFSPGAMDSIWEKSLGTPRLINQLSERALNEAYRRGKKGVGRRQVNRVADDPLYQPLFTARAKQWSMRTAFAGTAMALCVGVIVGLWYFGLGSKYLPIMTGKLNQVTAERRTLIKKPIIIPKLAEKREYEPRDGVVVEQEGTLPVVTYDEAPLQPDSPVTELNSLVEPLSLADDLPVLELSAIAWDENRDRSIAVLNHRIVHEGDFIGEVRVLQIKPNHVVLLRGNEHIIKKIHVEEKEYGAETSDVSTTAEKEQTTVPDPENNDQAEQTFSYTNYKPIIYFEYRTSNIAEDAYEELDRLATIAALSPDYEIVIRGYTDNVGSPKYNKKLSGTRTQIVRNYLVGKGIDPEKIKTISMGEKDPLLPNTTPAGRAVNRRVEIELVPVGDS